MKKLLLSVLCVFMLCGSLAYGQDWYTANQITINWDASAGLENGDPIPETDVIEYRLYLSNAVTDPDKINSVEIGTTGETSYVITLVDEGQYFVGLQTLRKLANGDTIGESVIGWTDDPDIVAGGLIFGIRQYQPPRVPHEVSATN